MFGIVTRVVADDQLDESVIEMATLIASRPALAVRMIRENIQALGNPDVVSTLRREKIAQSYVFSQRMMNNGDEN